jgi:predicted amidophosphoribosyltransferase
MKGQPFGELLSARRCWACCSDDLTECTWAVIDRRLICGACLRGRDIPRTIAQYRGRAGAARASLRAAYNAIVGYKEQRPGAEAFGPVLATVLAQAITNVAAVHGVPSDAILVPVPSYREQRTHMRVLCSLAARELSGVDPKPVLEKVTDFRQSRLSAAARRAASAEAYRVHGRVKNRTVIVADDIMTTGATLAACANALYDKGAAEVLGAAILRAVRRPGTGLVVLGSRQVNVRWTEVDERRRTGISPGRSVLWVRFACGPRCPHILTAGPFRVPALGTESLHAWSCDCGEKHAVTIRREWRGESHERIELGVGSRQASELLVALRHFRG